MMQEILMMTARHVKETNQPVQKISLFHKLIISYAAISLFTLFTLVVSYTGLYFLNRTAREIVTKDFVLINSLSTLRQSILAQRSYTAKFSILKGPEYKELYLQREAEFLDILQKLQKTAGDHSLDSILPSFNDFAQNAHRIIEGTSNDSRILKISADKVSEIIEKSLADRQRLLGTKLEAAKQREQSTIRWTIILSLTGFLLAIGVAAFLLYNISTAVGKLKRATQRIASGDFDFDPSIPPGDEVGDLAEDFISMARRLKELEQMSLDASPLTRLPGNIAIEQVLVKKLAEEVPFAVCYADLDNFKAYNDRYGYIKASELIKKTGEIVYEAVHLVNSRDAFVGHIGGDDLVMVVTPEEVAGVCEAVIEEFGKTIPAFYSPEDNKNGGIEGVDRYGVPRTFPIMTISIAVVICQKGTYDSAVTVARAAAEMKDHLKGKPGSNYSINRRLQPR